MFLEAIAVGSLIYLVSLFNNKVERPPAQLDIILQPIDPHRIAPQENGQQGVVKKTSRETLKDKNDVSSGSTDPQDVALDLINQLNNEYKYAPSPIQGREGIYVGEDNQFIPLNLDV